MRTKMALFVVMVVLVVANFVSPLVFRSANLPSQSVTGAVSDVNNEVANDNDSKVGADNETTQSGNGETESIKLNTNDNHEAIDPLTENFNDNLGGGDEAGSNAEAFYDKMNEIYNALTKFNSFGTLSGLYDGEFKKSLTTNFSKEDFVLGLTYAESALSVYQNRLEITPTNEIADINSVENNDDNIFIINRLYSFIVNKSL